MCVTRVAAGRRWVLAYSSIPRPELYELPLRDESYAGKPVCVTTARLVDALLT